MGGSKLGLLEHTHANFTLAAMFADLSKSGFDNVIEKIVRDFTTHAVPVTRSQIAEELRLKRSGSAARRACREPKDRPPVERMVSEASPRQDGRTGEWPKCSSPL
jgi:hypothetical protein